MAIGEKEFDVAIIGDILGVDAEGSFPVFAPLETVTQSVGAGAGETLSGADKFQGGAMGITTIWEALQSEGTLGTLGIDTGAIGFRGGWAFGTH